MAKIKSTTSKFSLVRNTYNLTLIFHKKLKKCSKIIKNIVYKHSQKKKEKDNLMLLKNRRE